ncbi:hypothetical protein SmJEL517_g03400 [Synchytrium microbalum]|uniref:Protein kinase domain-containing protein n=1 Tax=Synchytrium microbalum TaxID=1806994 RepID=A0A507BY64_9FUNG|nr:uncharacterized protein SmJEL517_g03400 [Synchytrium microbalum]TPX33727.1 hypothetical protein SmJEL517_g03400 [Synchytrium microbalum]
MSGKDFANHHQHHPRLAEAPIKYVDPPRYVHHSVSSASMSHHFPAPAPHLHHVKSNDNYRQPPNQQPLHVAIQPLHYQINPNTQLPTPIASPINSVTKYGGGSAAVPDSRGTELDQLHPAFLNKYQVYGNELGSGATSFVRSARTISGEDVAVKFIYKELAGLNGFMRDPVHGILPMEIFLLRKLRHNNIIRFIECFEDHRYYYLVTEIHGDNWSKKTRKLHKNPSERDLTSNRPDSGVDLRKPRSNSSSSSNSTSDSRKKRTSRDLFECLENNPFISEEQVWIIFRQIASAVAYLHYNGVVHKDIKDENVVVSEDLVAKLIDFGSAQPMPRHPSQFSIGFNGGTIHYQSPESLRQIPHDGRSSDVWALGVLLYILANGGEVPFADALSVCEARYLAPRYKRSDAFTNLLNLMLEPDQLRRINIDQVMAHPWITGWSMSNNIE